MLEIGKNVLNERGQETKIILGFEDGSVTIEKKTFGSDDQIMELTTIEYEALWLLLSITRSTTQQKLL